MTEHSFYCLTKSSLIIHIEQPPSQQHSAHELAHLFLGANLLIQITNDTLRVMLLVKVKVIILRTVVIISNQSHHTESHWACPRICTMMPMENMGEALRGSIFIQTGKMLWKDCIDNWQIISNLLVLSNTTRSLL